jgi:hypothetical protein
MASKGLAVQRLFGLNKCREKGIPSLQPLPEEAQVGRNGPRVGFPGGVPTSGRENGASV